MFLARRTLFLKTTPLIFNMAAQQQTLARFFGSNKNKEVESPKKKKRSTPPTSTKNSPKKIKTIVEVDSVIQEHKKVNELKDIEEVSKIENTLKKQPVINSSKQIPYSKLVNVFNELEQESGRLKNMAAASKFFLEVLESYKDDLDRAATNLTQVTYLMINRLGPDYEQGLELGLGETLLIKALATSTGRSAQDIKKDYHEKGDIGVVAKTSRSKQSIMFKPKALVVSQVYNNLKDIASSTGNSSQTKKISIITKMLTSCEGDEAKFLMRSLEGKLRINFGEKSVLMSLSKAIIEFQKSSGGTKKVATEDIATAEEQIKDTFSQVPNYEIIIRKSLENGILNLSEHCGLEPGVPVKPMLAKPTKSITEILNQFDDDKEFTCEYKYDGERAQLHLMEDGSLKIYSRNSEDMTERYPDLIAVMEEMKSMNPNIKSFILDCECVAYDVEKDKILPFQILSTRKRKGVKEEDIKVRICLFAFDMLLFNGEVLIRSPLKVRRQYLHDNLKLIKSKFQFATKMDSRDINEIDNFLNQSIKDSCEGLMIKSVNGSGSYYVPSKRSNNWLKLKKDYLDGVGDSLDLIVIGGYIGKGKRTGNYGGFLLGSYNQDTGEIESACKIGTGFSDEMLAKLTELLKPKELEKPRASMVYGGAKPDVWFEPEVIFEVKTADLTTSPIYKSGFSYLDGEKGISLRFPRFIQIRDDKNIEDATSSDQVVEMYQSQAVLQQ